jgi:hypothetical protein
VRGRAAMGPLRSAITDAAADWWSIDKPSGVSGLNGTA